jgi:hypothetical protein
MTATATLRGNMRIQIVNIVTLIRTQSACVMTGISQMSMHTVAVKCNELTDTTIIVF